MIQRLRTFIYPVNDLAKATVWYSSFLSTVLYFDEPLCVGFSIGGYELVLLPSEKSAKPLNNLVTSWSAPSVDEAFAQRTTGHDVGDNIRFGSKFNPFCNISRLILIYNPNFGLVPQDS
jgi:hypothetical protein